MLNPLRRLAFAFGLALTATTQILASHQARAEDADCPALRAPWQAQYHLIRERAEAEVRLQQDEVRTKLVDFNSRYSAEHPRAEDRRNMVVSTRRFLAADLLVSLATPTGVPAPSGPGNCEIAPEAPGQGYLSYMPYCSAGTRWETCGQPVELSVAVRDQARGRRQLEVCSNSQFNEGIERVYFTGCMTSENFPVQTLGTKGRISASLYLGAAGGYRDLDLLGQSEADGVVAYMQAHGVPSRCMTCPVGSGDLGPSGSSTRASNPRGVEEPRVGENTHGGGGAQGASAP
jgi:hypothetical protein